MQKSWFQICMFHHSGCSRSFTKAIPLGIKLYKTDCKRRRRKMAKNRQKTSKFWGHLHQFPANFQLLPPFHLPLIQWLFYLLSNNRIFRSNFPPISRSSRSNSVCLESIHCKTWFAIPMWQRLARTVEVCTLHSICRFSRSNQPLIHALNYEVPYNQILSVRDISRLFISNRGHNPTHLIYPFN